jgi:hypothetical protein
MTRHVGLLKRLTALESAPTARRPLQITGGLPSELTRDIQVPIRIGRMSVVGGLPPLPGTNIIMPWTVPSNMRGETYAV